MEKQNILPQINHILGRVKRIDENISHANDSGVVYADLINLQYNYLKVDFLKQLSRLLENSDLPIDLYNKELEEILTGNENSNPENKIVEKDQQIEKIQTQIQIVEKKIDDCYIAAGIKII